MERKYINKETCKHFNHSCNILRNKNVPDNVILNILINTVICSVLHLLQSKSYRLDFILFLFLKIDMK